MAGLRSVALLGRPAVSVRLIPVLSSGQDYLFFLLIGLPLLFFFADAVTAAATMFVAASLALQQMICKTS